MKRRPLLIVGMAPSRTSDPSRPLDGVSGRALARFFGHEYVHEFADAVNLLERYPGKSRRYKGDRFPIRRARRRAMEVVELFQNYRHVLVLGAGPRDVLELEWFRWSEVLGARVAAIPHPSGCNHWYNDPRNRERVRRFVRRIRLPRD